MNNDDVRKLLFTLGTLEEALVELTNRSVRTESRLCQVMLQMGISPLEYENNKQKSKIS